MGIIRKTIGVGGDYADVGIAQAAIYAHYPYVFPGPHMTDDWILTIISDFTENTGTSNSPFFDGHYIEITNPDHFTITVAPNGAGGLKSLVFSSRPGLVTDRMFFYDLIFSIPFINPGTAFTFLGFFPGNQGYYVTALYKNCVFLCNGYAPTTASRTSQCIGLEGAAGLQWSNASIINCKFYNFGTGIGSPRIGTLQKVTVENCSFYNNYYGLRNNAAIPGTAQYNVKNVVVSESAGSDFFSSAATLANINFINCADSDGTLLTCGGTTTNPQTNIVAVDEFESLDSTSDDFLKLKLIDADVRISGIPRIGPAALKVKFDNSIEYSAPGKALPNGGIPPVLVSNDLAGNLYGEFGMYPIGCYNAQPKVFGEVWET